jgi:cell division protein FtsB
MSINTARGPLVVVHAVFATVVVISLSIALQEREKEVAQVKRLAHNERVETQQLQADITQQEALIDGLRQKDPYVVELVARDHLNYAGKDEFVPPPLPAIDKPGLTDTK